MKKNWKKIEKKNWKKLKKNWNWKQIEKKLKQNWNKIEIEKKMEKKSGSEITSKKRVAKINGIKMGF